MGDEASGGVPQFPYGQMPGLLSVERLHGWHGTREGGGLSEGGPGTHGGWRQRGEGAHRIWGGGLLGQGEGAEPTPHTHRAP